MFTIKGTLYGITYLIPVIYINETLIEQEISGVKVQASNSSVLFDLYGVTGSMRFVTDSTEYTAPFQGSDFTTEKTGSLFIVVTEALSIGLHRGYLVNYIDIPGACGYGISGSIQAGNRSRLVADSGIVLQVQSLPGDWRSDLALTAQQYPVDTITRL